MAGLSVYRVLSAPNSTASNPTEDPLHISLGGEYYTQGNGGSRRLRSRRSHDEVAQFLLPLQVALVGGG